ncbi:MAG: hypothetical protein ABSC94_25745 [Polyangiaceae bacterium]|jgi:hypothetical protein
MAEEFTGWEHIVELARRLDERAAARSGFEVEAVLVLSRAVLAFHQALQSGTVVLAPQSGDAPA